MSTYNVTMYSYYGMSHYGSEETWQESKITVEGELAATLDKYIEEKGGKLTDAGMKELLNDGVSELSKVDDEIYEMIKEMNLRYWVSEDSLGNCDIEALIEEDEKDGYFFCESFESFCYDHGYDMDSEDFDESSARCEYEIEVESEYEDWFETLDLREQAERLGIDIYEAYHAMESSYTIEKCME